MSELDDAIDTLELRSKGPAVGIAQRSRAELAQLRADLQAAQERSVEQARKLDAAREIIDQSISDLRGVLSLNDDNTIEEMIQNIAGSLMRWLAANPATEAEPTP